MMFKKGDKVIVVRTSVPRFKNKIGIVREIKKDIATIDLNEGEVARFFTHRLDHLREENEI